MHGGGASGAATSPLSEPGAAELAEAALHAGKWLNARGRASEVLARRGAARDEVARAFFVLLQVDFHTGRLTDLREAAQFYGRDLASLPAPVVLLWGVIACEMDAGAKARGVLGDYTASCATAGAPLPRDDRLALARLFAVRVLRCACGDAAAAREWLTSAGAGLQPDERELLLAELEDAEAADPGAASSVAARQPEQEQQQPPLPLQQQQGPGAASPAWPPGPSAGWASGGLGEPGAGLFALTGEIEALEDAWPPGGGPSGAAGACAEEGGGGRGGGGAGPRRPGVLAWARGKAAECWDAAAVQDALRALHLDGVPAWQLAGGAAAAALLGYSLYRERRALRRAAASAAGGALQALAGVAAMATGFEPNAMAAVPRAIYG